jgi:hypothetical protein
MKSEKGASAIEFAIVLPVLVLLIFGCIEFGLLCYDKQVITNASREGARAGIVAQSPRLEDHDIKQVVLTYCGNYLITFGDDVLDEDDIKIVREGDLFGHDLNVTISYNYDFLVVPYDDLNVAATTLMKME